jgi:hypothetical protein
MKSEEEKKKQKEVNKKYRQSEKGKTAYAKAKLKYKKTEKGKTTSLNLRCKSYNLTIDDYNKMFTSQNGCCKICGKHQSEFKKSLSIDHNHQTNEVRGLLCNNCNTILGHAKDDIEILQNAIKYLKSA